MYDFPSLVPLCCLAVHLKASNLHQFSIRQVNEYRYTREKSGERCRLLLQAQSERGIKARTVAASRCPFPPLLGRLASLECFGFLLSSALVRVALPMAAAVACAALRRSQAASQASASTMPFLLCLDVYLALLAMVSTAQSTR